MKKTGLLLIIFFSAISVGAAQLAHKEGLTLGQCIQLAMVHSTPMKLAQTQLELANGVKLEYMAKFYPKGEVTAISIPAMAFFSFSQPIISPKMFPTSRATNAAVNAAQINIQLTLNEYVYELRRLFANALRAQKATQLQKEYYQLLERRMQGMHRMFDAGKITKTELVQLQVRFNLVQQELASLQIEEERKRLELFQWMGLGSRDPMVKERMIGDFYSDLPDQKSDNQLIELAKKQRLDYQLLKQVVKVADAQVRVAAADFYPTLAAGVNSTMQFWKPDFLDGKRQDEDGKTVDDSSMTAGLYVTWRLFDGGETLGKKIEAETQAKDKELLLEEIERDIPQQVSLSLSNLKAAFDSFHLLDQNESTSEEALKSARTQFDRGKIAQLELMKTEEDHYILKRSKLDALYRLEEARIDYLRARGENVQFIAKDVNVSLIN